MRTLLITVTTLVAVLSAVPAEASPVRCDHLKKGQTPPIICRHRA